MHGNRLVHRYGIGGFRRGCLGQRGQTVGEVIDTGIAAGAFQILETVIDQTTERVVASLAGAVLVGLHVQHVRHSRSKILYRG
ncbi:hypothetical protein D3C85_1508090 [compost metagenome]